MHIHCATSHDPRNGDGDAHVPCRVVFDIVVVPDSSALRNVLQAGSSQSVDRSQGLEFTAASDGDIGSDRGRSRR